MSGYLPYDSSVDDLILYLHGLKRATGPNDGDLDELLRWIAVAEEMVGSDSSRREALEDVLGLARAASGRLGDQSLQPAGCDGGRSRPPAGQPRVQP